MKKTIWFDMDGTLADLYSVDGWLADLESYNPRPYKEATTMVNMRLLARLLNALHNHYNIGVISWLSKTSTPEYDMQVTKVKKEWLGKHLKSVTFDEIHIVKYGTSKSNFAKVGDILFDDEIGNRTDWIGDAFDETEIINTLKGLTSVL